MARITRVTRIDDSGVAPATAAEIFDQIALFAGYGFNKSHAAAYAAISFRTAWLRTHHPEAFFASAMNADLDDVEAIATYASELKARGIMLWHPCVNRSGGVFTPVRMRRTLRGRDFAVSYGLAALRGLGRTAADAIVAERRARGGFTSVADFIARTGVSVNKRALQALARSGAFDSIATSRAQALHEIEGGARLASDARSGQMSLFDAAPEVAAVEEVPPLDRLEMLDMEFDTLGHYITGHPLDPLRDRLREQGLYFSKYVLKTAVKPPRRASMAAVVSQFDVRATRSGDTMVVLTLSDPDGVYEALAFAEAWSGISGIVRRKAALVFEMAVSERNGERRLVVEDASALASDEDGSRAITLEELIAAE